MLGPARERSDAIARAAGDAGDAAAAFAVVGLAGLALASSLPAESVVSDVAGIVATERDVSEERARVDLLVRTLAEVALSQSPPRVTLDAQLAVLAALVPAAGVSVWLPGPGGEAACIASAGAGADAGHDERAVAVPLVEADAILVARPVTQSDGERCAACLELAKTVVAAQVDRERRREAEAEEQAALAEAGERRRVRLGLDLHDGALQGVVALAADLRLFRAQLAAVVGDDHLEIVLGRVDDIDARLGELERELRELAQSLQPRSLLARPFVETVRDEVESFAARWGISAAVVLDGGFAALTASQRLAVLRIVQEALTNAREHGSAARVDVSLREDDGGLHLQIVDDGRGFAVASALERAAANGRLGLAGMRERAALLGGSFAIESRPGGPTTVSARLPRWTPMTPVG